MTGSYLFNYESYYNGLMTDLGLLLLLRQPIIPKFEELRMMR